MATLRDHKVHKDNYTFICLMLKVGKGQLGLVLMAFILFHVHVIYRIKQVMFLHRPINEAKLKRGIGGRVTNE